MNNFRTVVALLAPEAEPFVGEFRRRHTPGGARGMPAHVTLLSPFVNTDEFNQDVCDRLLRAIEDFAAFDFWLSKLERFDRGVLYQSVEPVERVRALIGRICDGFPPFQPYGEFTAETVIPHQTLVVAEAYPEGPTSRDLDLFADVEREASRVMPIKCKAKDVVVLADGPDGWSVARVFALR